MQSDLVGFALFKLAMAATVVGFSLRYLAGLLVRALEAGPDVIG